MAEKEKLIDFYCKCEKEGIKELSDAYSERKAAQIAKIVGVNPGDNIKSLFEEAKRITFDHRNNSERKAHIMKVIEAEKTDTELYQQLSLFSELYGTDKPVGMLNAAYRPKLDELNSQISKYEKVARSNDAFAKAAPALMQASRIKEKDWAIAGGIAEGIAGPAAGLASALDVQMQNQAIRAKNTEINNMYSSLASYAIKGVIDAEFNKDHCQKELGKVKQELKSEISKYQIKVIGDEDDDETFKDLNIFDVKYQISLIGSVHVTVSLFQNKSCVIFGDKKAYIDGTLCAKIYQNDNLIGVADLVLPIDGTLGHASKERPLAVKGICLCGAQSNEPCRIEIIPKNLWKIEA